jgi:hypothetical protein
MDPTPKPAARFRRPRPEDREAASALLEDVRPLDASGCHVVVAGEPLVTGVAVWLDPPPGGDEACLGPVMVSEGRPSLSFYQLVLACTEEARAAGYARGAFTIKDRGMLRLLRLTFRIDPVPTGWEPEGGSAREWEVHVDLQDAVEQLRGVIAALDRRAGR